MSETRGRLIDFVVVVVVVAVVRTVLDDYIANIAIACSKRCYKHYLNYAAVFKALRRWYSIVVIILFLSLLRFLYTCIYIV